ncbi:MAG: hypothetical protein ACJ786_31320 [Catenulispora sp.]
MSKKKIQSAADAHELALIAVKRSRAKLRTDRATAKEKAVIRRSHERGDNRHDKGRLS